ncbi:MAG: DNA helicase II [Gammaproteobacteria bacterium]|nr:DNA helicase II [Gammaproteobacteria bacterium]
MIDTILEHLNPEQYAAVTAPKGHVLVLAGAGSGKTRVLVHRIAWLLTEQCESPHSILAVTFTNKAAAEMRHRLEDLVGASGQRMWLGTFHSLAHRMLRLHWRDAGLAENFQILDSEDQLRLIRRVMKELNIDEKQSPAKQAQWYISNKKEEGLRPHHIEHYGDPSTRTLLMIYQAYDAICQQNSLVDFTELLLRCHELLLGQPEILAHYQQRFNYILVDEFQDTNSLQYAWLRLLAGDNAWVMVVGDDDQSIYGWRGAKVENIKQFCDNFTDTTIIRLEQNYRSTKIILDAANHIINNNKGRLGKNLWTELVEGEPISVYNAYNEVDEARFITARIQQAIERGFSPTDIALLYRSNVQSRTLEEALLQAGIAYRIYGGLRFYDRAEIKDALAYLRLVYNSRDDQAFERAVQTPPRGIGDKTMELIRETARAGQISLWQATKELLETSQMTSRASNAVAQFYTLISDMQTDAAPLDLHAMLDMVITRSGLIPHFQQERGEKGQARIENLSELIDAARLFAYDADDEFPVMAAFLAHAALESGERQSAGDDAVQLMTLHSAKGLEFPIVFMCGMEEGLFPHYMCLNDPKQLEEERRLCYVGMTRARKKLYLTYAESRRLHGNETRNRPSRFLKELPPDCYEEVRLRSQTIKTVSPLKQLAAQSQEENREGLMLGQRVYHQLFGEGVILDFEGDGAHKRVQVRFDKVGTKWLVASFAKLVPVYVS